jgi:O-antigen/teichoic acid export membrane protein
MVAFATNATTVRLLDDADKVVLGIFSGFETVGIYTAAYRAAAFILVPMRGVLARAMPQMFRYAANEDLSSLMMFLKKTQFTLLWTFVLTAFPLGLAALAIPTVLGPGYAESRALCLALIPALALRAFHFTLGDVLTSVGRLRARSGSQVLGLALPLAALLLLVPRFGAWGAVVATYIGEAATVLAMAAVVRRISHETDRRPT